MRLIGSGGVHNGGAEMVMGKFRTGVNFLSLKMVACPGANWSLENEPPLGSPWTTGA
jgi:hypothetical protein